MYGGNLVTRSLNGNRIVGGTWTLGSGATWTLPAVTLGGTLDANGQAITGLNNLGFGTNITIYQDADSREANIRGGTIAVGKGTWMQFTGVDHANTGGWLVATPNAAGDGDITRLTITGKLATAVATWAGVTHSGLDITSGQVLNVAGTQVVGARVVDARADDVVDATYGAEEAGVLDALRDCLLTHGLLAAA